MKNLTGEKKLAALLERRSGIDAAVKAVREERKLAAARDAEKLALIVGRALLAEAAKIRDFELMLRGVLRTAIADGTSDYNYLKTKGWL